MEVKRGSRGSIGSCNFCDRGKLTPDGKNLRYPYSEVTSFTKGNGLMASICDECLEELYAKAKMVQL